MKGEGLKNLSRVLGQLCAIFIQLLIVAVIVALGFKLLLWIISF